MLAHVLFSLDDTSGAEAVLDELEVRLRDAGLHLTRVMTHLVRAHIELARSDVAAAERWAQEALACATERELRLAHTDALETLASIAFQKGDAAAAARLLGAAEAFREHTGYRWRWPHREDEIAALRPQLDAAHLVEGAALSLSEAAEYARRGWGERGRPLCGWDSLTPSELRVVELVAAGLPNRDIAAKLFVSLATVKTHLVHVYTKLDVRTRTELAAAATRRSQERAPI
jgi:ATP/maltotriose-dependent transcriptional regulator MalT